MNKTDANPFILWQYRPLLEQLHIMVPSVLVGSLCLVAALYGENANKWFLIPAGAFAQTLLQEALRLPRTIRQWRVDKTTFEIAMQDMERMKERMEREP